MDLELFESIVAQSVRYTKEIYCHVVGDPMTLSNLSRYLDIIDRYSMRATLTTSGYYIDRHRYSTLLHPAVKQINISINSYNKNDNRLTLEEYLKPMISLCQKKIVEQKEIFINFRLWNFDEVMSERDFNQKIFSYLSKQFSVDLDIETIDRDRPKSIRLDYKILLHFDNYFEWPSLNNPLYGDGTCQGLSSHIAILSDGRVVPCCLDCDAVIELGDLNIESLDDILKSRRSVTIIDNFKDGVAIEELCQHCSYKERFKR
jgi:radical SAM protein with 4Fe4S-binding SPASM domain